MELTKSIETERVQLRILQDSDVEAVFRQFSDEDMCKYFSDPPCSREEAQEIIDHYREPEGKGHLRYGLFDKTDGTFIGTCGYHFLDMERGQVEIGYDTWKEFWKKGYMKEALSVLLDICFSYPKIHTIYILTHPENTASQAVARKFGFKECKPLRDGEDEQLCMRLLKDEWHQ